jgi:hypothetical protein
MQGSGMSATSGTATLQIRYSFCPQYMAGAGALVRLARAIESITNPSEAQTIEHRALIVGAVTQSAAAIESELADVCMYPEHRLDLAGKLSVQQIQQLSGFLKGTDTLKRWNRVLKSVGKPKISLGCEPAQKTRLLIDLRNELMHYKSGQDGYTQEELIGRLRNKAFVVPAFMKSHSPEWPLRVLHADLAEWALKTAAEYLDEVSDHLGIVGVLDRNRAAGSELAALLPPRIKPKRPSSKRRARY